MKLIECLSIKLGKRIQMKIQLHAHSHRVDIIVENSGLDSVRVIDDGDAIAAEDINQHFHRHATSKINSRHDLFKCRRWAFVGKRYLVFTFSR